MKKFCEVVSAYVDVEDMLSGFSQVLSDKAEANVPCEEFIATVDECKIVIKRQVMAMILVGKLPARMEKEVCDRMTLIAAEFFEDSPRRINGEKYPDLFFLVRDLLQEEKEFYHKYAELRIGRMQAMMMVHENEVLGKDADLADLPTDLLRRMEGVRVAAYNNGILNDEELKGLRREDLAIYEAWRN